MFNVTAVMDTFQLAQAPLLLFYQIKGTNICNVAGLVKAENMSLVKSCFENL